MGKLTKKAGPFPVWVWIAGAAAILYIVHARRQAATANTAAMYDPNSVNPQLDPGTIDGSGLGGLGVGTGAGSDIGTGYGYDPSLGATTGASPGSPDPTLTDPGAASSVPLPAIVPTTPALRKLASAIRGTRDHDREREHRHHRSEEHHHHVHRTPARIVKGREPGGKPIGHRAPHHPNEDVHAHHPSHFIEPPAHQRVKAHNGHHPTFHAGGLTGTVTRAPARASRSGQQKNGHGATQTRQKAPNRPPRSSRSGAVK